MFTALKNRYLIEGALSFEGPVAVSTGESDDRTDAPVMKRTQDRMPFIPGASFRGALRATVERILAGLELPVCLLGANPKGKNCLTVSKENQKRIQALIKQSGSSEETILQDILDTLCPACGLFGSPFLASRLKVSDLPGDGTAKDNLVIRHRVGIDRDTETAREGAKFDGEVVEKGSFQMELVLENVYPQDWGMLGLGLLELKVGDFWVGGDQSVGAGRCSLKDLTIRYFGENGYGLKDFLAAGEYQTKDDPWGFVIEHVKRFLEKSEGVISYSDLHSRLNVPAGQNAEPKEE